MREFITDLLAPVFDVVGVSGASVTVIMVLGAFLLYSRKALVVGSVVAEWTSRVMFAVALLLVLVVAGVAGIDVSRLFSLIGALFRRLAGVFA